MFKQATELTWAGAWIGIQRNQADDKLYWIDGTPVSGGYTAWAPESPNNNGGREDCGHIFGNTGRGYEDYRRKWNDVPCALKGSWFRVILCEKSLR